MTSKWQTTVEIPQSTNRISYSTPMLFLGSCFSDNISKKLSEYKFNVLSNPFGVLYNPYSIQTSLRLLMHEIDFDDKNLIYHNNNWHSLLHHSAFSSPNKELLKQTISESISQASGFLKKAQYLFITLGSSWVYYHKATQQNVANCHKIPEQEFRRFRLSVCDITDEYSMLIESLQKYNPNLKIIFTISPIRHWKDGAVENQLSKSILNVSVHQLIDLFNNEIEYFPSYETVMDELRDYRFYSEDMIHIAPQTIEHIFCKFINTFISGDTQNKMNKIAKIIAASKHRPFDSSNEQYKAFCEKNISEIETISKALPNTNWEKEISIFMQK